MARRSPGGITRLLIVAAVVITACSATPAATTVGYGETTSSSTDLTSAPSTIPGPATTTTSSPSAAHTTTPSSSTTSTVGVPSLPGMQVMVPDGEGPFPAIVLVHGGGWVVGSPDSMEPLAVYLTESGYLTVNTRYQLSLQAPGYPAAVEDVACAVAFAASHPDSNGSVVLVGHSAGAHLSSLVALDPDRYRDGDCTSRGTGIPQGLVGLAGPYDISRLGSLMTPFFGVDETSDPDSWASGNPFNAIGSAAPIPVLLIHGDADPVVPADFSEQFYAALDLAGYDVMIELLTGVDHPGARSPAIVGQIITEWLGS